MEDEMMGKEESEMGEEAMVDLNLKAMREEDDKM
jgi:hypothetical protein